MRFVPTICLLLCSLAATPARAETHGGVKVSNAQVKVTSDFVLFQSGEIHRVLKVRKIVECDRYSIFEASFGGQRPDGRDQISRTELYKLTRGKFASGEIKNIEITNMTSPSCGKD